MDEQQHLKEQQHLTAQFPRTAAEHHQRTPSEQLQHRQQGSLDEYWYLEEPQRLEGRQHVAGQLQRTFVEHQ